ncbi:MAG: Chromate reductase [Alphaproteobacteria bacterium MarineAlpha3_Bin5]|nr:NADPH-dependent FMN reductase [Magnetovibrio sp.]PPR80009.1 MAG: Chromate reductase [Alphaproteobacteria bacterium MarineAlpha3_Bin5]
MEQHTQYALLAISGSLRKASFNTLLAKYLKHIAPKNLSINTMTLHNLPLYNADEDVSSSPESVKFLRDSISNCDGLILVSPEYNYGPPGVLKNAIDWASRPAFNSVLKSKPVLIITASAGPAGGTRANAQLRDTLAGTLSRVVVRKQVAIGTVNQKLEGNRVNDPDTTELLKDSLNDLVLEIKIARLFSREN